MTMFILGVGTSPGGKARVGKSNTMNAGVGGGRPLTSPAPGSVGRRSTISYDQAKTSSSSTERTNEVTRYSVIQLLLFEIQKKTRDKPTRMSNIEYNWKESLALRDKFSIIHFFSDILYMRTSRYLTRGILDAYSILTFSTQNTELTLSYRSV